MKIRIYPRLFYVITLLFFINYKIAAQEIIPLYEGKVPNMVEDAPNETHHEGEILWITDVNTPTLEVFAPTNKHRSGKAVIICPGGGYEGLAYDMEGTEIAKWFNTKGITAFVLKYRLPNIHTDKYKSEVSLSDAVRAIKLVRKNAEKWGVDKNKIGVIGFSAGGHLASTLGTHYDMDIFPNNDPYANISARPDFMILMYPVITMDTAYTHMGSRNALLGKQAGKQMVDLYSNETQITGQTPPAFIVHCEDDDVVPVENSLKFYQSLKNHRVSAELHLYPEGGHGFGLAINNLRINTWPEQLLEWLQYIDTKK